MARGMIRHRITVRRLVRAAAMVFNLEESDITGHCRQRHLVYPRFAVIYLARKLMGRSYPQIGVGLNRDHSTVIHGYHRARWLLRDDPEFARNVTFVQMLAVWHPLEVLPVPAPVAVEPEPEPKPAPKPLRFVLPEIEPDDDMEWLSRRVAAHYARQAA